MSLFMKLSSKILVCSVCGDGVEISRHNLGTSFRSEDMFLRSQLNDADLCVTLGKHMNADHVSRLF